MRPRELARSFAKYLCILLFLALAASGCTETKSGTQTILERESKLEQKLLNNDSLREAFRYLPQMLQLERGQVVHEIGYQLQSWAEGADKLPDWKSPELLNSLPPFTKELKVRQRLDLFQFSDRSEPECEYLFQCNLMSKVNKWVLDKPYRDSIFGPWLEQQQKQLPEADALRIEAALKLFDWTICNVSMTGAAKDIETFIPNPTSPLREFGPGYSQLPWLTMMYAEGDAIERSRVFTQLAFQSNIPVVWLARSSPTGGDDVQLWLLGVPVGGEMYLLDPRLGMPLPGSKPRTIATLKEAQEDPTVLRRAKVPGWFDYPATADNIKRLVAFFDVEPFALSRVMASLEQSLTGDLRLKLAADVAQWKDQVLAAAPNLDVRLWAVPWMAQEFNARLRDRLDDKSPVSYQYLNKYSLVIMPTPVSKARLLHMEGKFESSLTEQGAVKSYMQLRVSDEDLKRLPTDKDLQKELQLERAAFESQEAYMFRLAQMQMIYRRAKLDANVYIAMTHFALGKYRDCIDFLQKRLLALEGTERWHPLSWYLIGRANEQLGKTGEAADWFRRQPANEETGIRSPQEAGNRIRVRLLQTEE